MPKRRRHHPGEYKSKTTDFHNFTGQRPLRLFQAENGLWGVKDGAGKIEIEPEYVRVNDQTEWERKNNAVRLVSKDTVLIVTPEYWEISVWFSERFD